MTKQEKFIENNIHYIKETYPNGTINIYPDPEFQKEFLPPPKPTLPDLTTPAQMLIFIIEELGLKKRFSP